MDLSGNQTNPLYAQLQPYVDDSYGAVRCIPTLHPPSDAAAYPWAMLRILLTDGPKKFQKLQRLQSP